MMLGGWRVAGCTVLALLLGTSASSRAEDPGAAGEAGPTGTEEDGPVRNPVVWWEINAKDGESLMHFYRAVFGWDCRHDEESGIWHLDSGQGRVGAISGGVFTGKGVLPPHRCLYVQVEDVDALVEKAKAEGCPILQGPFDLEGVGRLAFFEDPEGHMIGLLAPAPRRGAEP